MSNPPGYSHVIEVTGPHRTVYFAGQTGADANGKVSADFRAQAMQVFENIKIALGSVGGGFEHVVKVTAYHTNLEANAAAYPRGARACISRTRRRCRATPCAVLAARQSGLSDRAGVHRDLPAAEGQSWARGRE